jgi:hypothetical protein
MGRRTDSRSISLKAPLLVSVTLLLFTVPFAFTQKASVNKRAVEPQIQDAIAQPGTRTNEVLSNLLAFAPEIPRGPVEILRQYEDQMTLISQTFTIEISLITEAVHQGQVSRPQADYLMQQRFQIAMMQYEVLNALHDSLAFEVSRTPVPPHSHGSEAGTTIVVAPPGPVPSARSALRPN